MIKKSMIKKQTADLPYYLQLMRVDKPIGWLLLLWPTLWALWIAGNGQPDIMIVWVFVAGVFVMRSAGCVINDYADRDFDPKVARTQQRPLAAGKLKPRQALGLFVVLGLIAFSLLMLLPSRVWPWSIPAVLITIAYPFMKRFIQTPQLILGLAFSFGIPMAYVAHNHAFDGVFYLLVLANILWVLAFDTQYAMSDREDDLKIGVKSTAIFFGRKDRLIIGMLQSVVVMLFALIMLWLPLSPLFAINLCLVVGLFVYQQWLIRTRDRTRCFQAFVNNGWVGGILWFGLCLSGAYGTF